MHCTKLKTETLSVAYDVTAIARYDLSLEYEHSLAHG